MANESMRVVALMGRKGGSGKSAMVKALASAALAGGKSVLLVDTDPQGDLTLWFEDLQARAAVPAGASFVGVASTADLETRIHEAYERGDTDFVFIDTAGAGGSWSDEIAVMADHLVTPVVCSESDFKICAQTVAWFQRLHERVERPEDLPPHRVVLTKVPASAKTSRLQMKLMNDAMTRFPMINTVIQERSAYLEMDAHGFLGALAESYRAKPDALQRSHARRFEDAIVESTEVLNDILRG